MEASENSTGTNGIQPDILTKSLNELRNSNFTESKFGNLSRNRRTLSTDESEEDSIKLLESISMDDAKALILCYLCAEGDLLTVMKLLSVQDVDINRGDYDNRTPLHLASEEGHFECVKYLVEHGAEPSTLDRWGESPYQLALKHTHSQIALYLKEHGGSRLLNSESEEKLKKLCENIDLNLSTNQNFSISKLKEFLLKQGIELKKHPKLNKAIKQMVKNDVISWDTFKEFLKDDVTYVYKAINNKLVIPNWKKFCERIQKIYEETLSTLSETEGKTCSISICTVDGQTFSIGDCKQHFPIESCAKPILYSLVLETIGYESLHKWIGMEPSGKMFNDFTLNQHNKPHNACIDSGGMVLCALFHPHSGTSERFKMLFKSISELAGESKLGFNQEFYLTLVQNSYVNRALAYYMASLEAFPKVNIEDAVDFFFQMYCIDVNAENLASIAACYANYGLCPLTQKKIFKFETVKRTMQLMFSCGMYDFSGEWACTVGIPSKSGGSGAIMLSIPDIAGLCIHAPDLDRHVLNDSLGVKLATNIANEFGWNLFDLMFQTEPEKTNNK